MKKRTLVIALALGTSAALWWGRPAVSSSAPRSVAALRAPNRAAAPARSVSAATAPAPAAQPQGPVLTASWGGGRDQLGRDRPAEGSPVGPMSFAADARGRLLVLDNVNDRVVRRGPDGKTEAMPPRIAPWSRTGRWSCGRSTTWR